MAVDPVCKMKVDGRKTSHRSVHLGEKYYFCSSGCMRKFEKDPERYIEGAAEVKVLGPEAVKRKKKPWWRFW